MSWIVFALCAQSPRAISPDFLAAHSIKNGATNIEISIDETDEKLARLDDSNFASTVLNAVKQMALRALGAGRVCFGSDTPFGFMHVRLAMYKALLRDFSAQEQDMVLHANIARVLLKE